jgi:hypothetical protein
MSTMNFVPHTVYDKEICETREGEEVEVKLGGSHISGNLRWLRKLCASS